VTLLGVGADDPPLRDWRGHRGRPRRQGVGSGNVGVAAVVVGGADGVELAPPVGLLVGGGVVGAAVVGAGVSGGAVAVADGLRLLRVA
jgi:hypothetical protein